MQKEEEEAGGEAAIYPSNGRHRSDFIEFFPSARIQFSCVENFFEAIKSLFLERVADCTRNHLRDHLRNPLRNPLKNPIGKAPRYAPEDPL